MPHRWHGVAREHTLSQLKALDIGYGYRPAPVVRLGDLAANAGKAAQKRTNGLNQNRDGAT
jgi:hypothetical protein